MPGKFVMQIPMDGNSSVAYAIVVEPIYPEPKEKQWRVTNQPQQLSGNGRYVDFREGNVLGDCDTLENALRMANIELDLHPEKRLIVKGV